jgi:hypothetical protein
MRTKSIDLLIIFLTKNFIIMKKTNFATLAAVLMLIAAVVFTGCKKDDEPKTITGEALFSFVADGLTVTFTNESDVTPPVTYLWDFGDSETSTDKDPVHTYASKGEYTVKLTVADENAGKHDVSTKINVDRKGRITFNDGDLSDWDVVTEAQFVVPLGDNSGVMVAAKYEYDADYVYAYYVFEGTIGTDYQFDLMIDYDNDSTTGTTSYLWPASGCDYLPETWSFASETAETHYYDFTGVDGTDDWTFEEDMTMPSDAMEYGTMTQVGANVAFEIRLKRDLLPNFTNDVLSFGLFISDADWAEIGFAPDKTPEGGAHTGYFKFEMK